MLLLRRQYISWACKFFLDVIHVYVKAAKISPYKPEFTSVILIQYKPRSAVAILDLYWRKIPLGGWQTKKMLLFLNQLHELFVLNHPGVEY